MNKFVLSDSFLNNQYYNILVIFSVIIENPYQCAYYTFNYQYNVTSFLLSYRTSVTIKYIEFEEKILTSNINIFYCKLFAIVNFTIIIKITELIIYIYDHNV